MWLVSHQEGLMTRATTASPRIQASGRRQVEAYLASVPAEARKALQRLRETIRAAAPGAEEGLSYGLPAFRLAGRPLVCYSAAKAHCSFFPMSPAVIRGQAEALKAYSTSKGTIRFSPDNPLPATLVRRLVRARVGELEPKK
jgi:uncharacterized protein YdhG (YjbR/CyaY superfamily)